MPFKTLPVINRHKFYIKSLAMHRPNTQEGSGGGGRTTGTWVYIKWLQRRFLTILPLSLWVGTRDQNTWLLVQLLSRSLLCENLQSLLTAKLLESQKAKSKRDPLPLATEEKTHTFWRSERGGGSHPSRFTAVINLWDFRTNLPIPKYRLSISSTMK